MPHSERNNWSIKITSIETILRAIGYILPQKLEQVVENLNSRLEYTRGSRKKGLILFKIIFGVKMNFEFYMILQYIIFKKKT